MPARFFTDARYAVDVIGGVTHQRREVDDQFWRHAVLIHHLFRAEDGIRHGIDKRNIWRHQLRHIFIASADQHRTPGFSASRARVPITSSASTPETASSGSPIVLTIAQGFDLCTQIVRHWRAM